MRLTHNYAPQTTTKIRNVGMRPKRFFAYLIDWRLILPGFLIVGYAAGILSAFLISGSNPIAVVHKGPYALTGLYKGNVYELIPMEEVVRLRQDQRQPQKASIRKIGTRNPVIEDLILPAENRSTPITNGPH